MKHGGGKISLNSPSDDEGAMMDTMPGTSKFNASPFGKKNSV
jgi:hypothetical protein